MTSNPEKTPEQLAEIQAQRLKLLDLISASNVLNHNVTLEEVLSLSRQLLESSTTPHTEGCFIYSGCCMVWQ